LRYENVDEATRKGIDANVKAHFGDRLTLSFGGTFVDVRDEETGDVIEDVPRILYTTTASYKYKWTTHSLQGKYVYNNSSHPETKDRVFIFDYLVKVGLPFRGLYGSPSLFAAVHNLTNSDYLVTFSAPQPGRWVEGGLKLEF
jgi:vitamin B12 transporter